MKILDGSELVGFIKERQAKQIRALRQAWGVFPKVVIYITKEDPVIDTYVRLKRAYGEDILVDVAIERVEQEQLREAIQQAAADQSVHGIVVQLPLSNPAQTDEILATIPAEKDVDGLRGDRPYIPATAMAIDWLLAGYNVTLKGKKIAIVGRGRLVGAPLELLWSKAGLDVTSYDDTTIDLKSELKNAEIIVTATGVPGLISTEMIRPGGVIVDAGTASENGIIVGDVAPLVRERNDVTITPIRGGVGPLTIAALFDNVIAAARATIPKENL